MVDIHMESPGGRKSRRPTEEVLPDPACEGKRQLKDRVLCMHGGKKLHTLLWLRLNREEQSAAVTCITLADR